MFTSTRNRGGIMRARETPDRRTRRSPDATRPRDPESDALRVLVRNLAREAARDAIARALDEQQRARPEVSEP